MANVRPTVSTVLTDAARHAATYDTSATRLFTAQSEFTQLYDAWRKAAGRVEGPVDIAIKQMLMNISRTLVYGAQDRAPFVEIAGLAALAAQAGAPERGSVEAVEQSIGDDIERMARALAPEVAEDRAA